MKATGIVRRTMRISRLSEACLGDDSLSEHIDTVRGAGDRAG